MRTYLTRSITLSLLLAASGAASHAEEKPYAFPTMGEAERMEQRHLAVSMMGKTAGGMSLRLGHLPGGRLLFETRMQMQIQRMNEGKPDIFRFGGYELELLGADGRVVASRSEKTEANVVETAEAVYGEKHVDVTRTGPAGTTHKRLDLPADLLSSHQVHQRLIAEWKEGTQPQVVYSTLDENDARWNKTTVTLLGKATYTHDGVTYPAWRIKQVDDQKQFAEGLVGDDFMPFEMSMMGIMKAVWTNEPVVEVETEGWSLSSYIDVRGVVPAMLKVQTLEARLRMDPPPESGKPALIVANAYQDVVAEADGYRVTLKAQRVPKEASDLVMPYEVKDAEALPFLGPTTQAQSDHEEIVAHARKLTASAKDPVGAVRRIVGWVWAHVDKETGARAGATALEVLKSCKGDCTEHAVLVVALCRAVGIPARQMSGIEYLSGKDKALGGFHAWAEVWLGRWVPVDATIPEVGTSGRYLMLDVDEPGVVSEGGTAADFLSRKLVFEVLAYTHEGAARVELPAAAPQGPK